VNQIVMETREGEVVVDCRLSEGEADQFRSLRPKIRPIVQMLTDLGREHLLEGCPHEHQPGCPVCEAYSLLTGRKPWAISPGWSTCCWRRDRCRDETPPTLPLAVIR
jgi:hypothetical protein